MALSLSIASYNLLAECYVRVPGQPWNAFENCPTDFLNWTFRAPRILSTIVSSNADVICLQEVVFQLQNDKWGLPEWMQELSSLGYELIMQGLSQKDLKSNAERNNRMVGRSTPTGLVTMYKKSKFSEFCPSKHGSGSGTTIFLSLSGSFLSVTNIHLVGDPSKVEAHEKQLGGAMKSIQKGKVNLPSVYSNFSSFICGDFNSEILPGTANYTWFDNNGYCRAPIGASWAADGHVEHLDHIMFKVDSSSVASSETRSSASAASDMLSVVSCKPSNDDLALSVLPSGLPSEEYPSDHFLIMVEFLLNSSTL